MPNYIMNRVTVSGKDTEKVFEHIKTEVDGEEISIDFNKIVPRPKDLDITSGSRGEMGYELFHDGKSKYGFQTKQQLQERFDKLNKKDQEEVKSLGAKYASNKKNFGHTTWYGWSIAHWGTKWNASSPTRTQNTLEFETAWNGVPNLITQLSTLFPSCTFEYKFADEDTGSNVGVFTIKDGRIEEDNSPDNRSKAAFDVAFDLRPEYKKYYELQDGQYIHTEE